MARLTRHPLVLDLALAIGVTAIAVAEKWQLATPMPGATDVEAAGRWAALTLGVIAPLSLALRRYLPLPVLLVTASSLAVSPAADGDTAGWLAMFIGALSAGLQHSDRRHVVATFILLAAIYAGIAVAGLGIAKSDPFFPGLVLLIAGTWWIGHVIRSRTREALAARERATRLEIEREREAERAATAERARIARELHDVIAHSLSVIVIQASAARRVLDRDPASARGSLDAIEETGRTAMVEMRRLLGVVRRDEPDVGAAIEPQPSLDGLGALVAEMRRAGLEVEVRIDGDRRPIAPGVDLSAYRIVQEALTNTLRHAKASRTEVVLTYLPNALEVRVVDDGSGNSDQAVGMGMGHGLVGMRERVALLRGELDAGPRPGGGFAVRAILPLEPTTPP